MHYAQSQTSNQGSHGAASHEEWPEHEAPPVPPMPETPPAAFGIARPARLLGIAWAVSVPAVLWSHLKTSTPLTFIMLGFGILAALGVAALIAWIAFHLLRRSRAAASGIFGGLASIGLAANVLLGVFLALASGALRDIDRGNLRTQLHQELAQAKTIASEEIVKAKRDGLKGVLTEKPVIKRPIDTDAPAPINVPELSPPPTRAESSTPARTETAVASTTQPPAKATPKVVIKPSQPPKAQPQVAVPQRGVSVRKSGTVAPAAGASMDQETLNRITEQSRTFVLERLEKATRRYARSAVALSHMRDPLLYTSPSEFREFRRLMQEHFVDAEALHDSIAGAPAAMRNRLSLAGVPTPRIDRQVELAFPNEVIEADTQFRQAYLGWLCAREDRARVLEDSIGRWKFDQPTKQLWLADDGVRSSCENAFEVLRVSRTTLGSKRRQAEDLGIPTRLQDMTNGASRVASEAEGL